MVLSTIPVVIQHLQQQLGGTVICRVEDLITEPEMDSGVIPGSMVEHAKSLDSSVALIRSVRLKRLKALIEEELQIRQEHQRIWYWDPIDAGHEALEICGEHSFRTVFKQMYQRRLSRFRLFLTSKLTLEFDNTES